MPVSIDRRTVLEMLDGDAQLVDVLPKAEYDAEHLPGAMHLPLKGLTADAAGALDITRPVIVYCWDGL